MENNFSAILGKRLLKISDVYAATGVSRSTLTSIYYQRSISVNLETLKKICDFLQVPLSELIEYTPKKGE